MRWRFLGAVLRFLEAPARQKARWRRSTHRPWPLLNGRWAQAQHVEGAAVGGSSTWPPGCDQELLRGRARVVALIAMKGSYDRAPIQGRRPPARRAFGKVPLST